ncbi:ESPR-type extended signal peptide-containing protein [Phascolarctobacterium succinatutens]|uniref:ESPR-type extended signal peptide-containing protein n=1 Tax=Phascolarctobacterium succinatutens TaxID=626940 RepID=UPI0026EE7082|nr:ESPR-type extended signal peptide-containing protein [Phascolarctobacterium succinatutens]
MNKVFKVIWNEARNAYVVVSEIAKNRGSKSCSTKKLLAMLIATGVMTCASFDVLAAPPTAAETARYQYVAFGDKTAGWSDGQEKTIDGHKYIYDATNKYWVREGYKLTVEENGKLHTPLSAHGKAADVAYIGGGDTGSILQSVTSMVSASGTVTNMGESLSRITASAFTGVSHSGGTAVVGDWNYIIQDSSWKDSDSVASGNYKDGYVDLIGPEGGMPKGFVTVGDKLKWDDTKQAYTYKGKPVDYSNVYVIDGKIGVFTNQSGSDFYKGTVFGKNNEILMTVKDADNNFYSYWASEVTDPSATMQSYRLAEYKKDLAVLVENDNKLHRDDIKEVTMTTDAGTNSAIIGLVRNGNTEAGAPVKGAITVTSGGGAGGKDTFVKISNGTANQTFATGSKVEAIGTTEATTGIKINGQEYTIKSGSVVSVAKDAANKTTTITVDGNATTITDTDTTYTAGDGIKINVGAISVSKNLTGMQSIQGAGEGKISFDGANVKVNNTTFGENSVVVGGGTDGKTPVTINGTDGVVSGLHNTNIGYTDFATKGNAATEEQLKKVMDAGWKFTTDSNQETTVKVGPDGTNANAVTFKGDSANVEVTNTGNNIKVALKKDLTVDSVKAGSSFMSATGIGYGDKAYITSSGLNANGQTITNVKAGEAETDAVNVGQLNAVKAEASKKTTLSNGKNTTVTSVTTDGQTDYKVNVAGDLKDITSVANGASEIKLNADSIIIANTNKTFAITNSGIGMSYVASDYSTKAIMLGENGTTISGGLNVAGSKISGVADGTIAAGSTNAVNGSQLYDVKNSINTDISNKTFGLKDEKGNEVTNTLGNTVQVKGADGITSTVKDGALEIGLKLQEGSNLVVNSNGLALNTALTGIQSITGAGTGAASIRFDGGNVKVNDVTIEKGGKITGVADGVNANDAVNVSQLNKVNAEAGKHTTLIDGKNTKVEETTNAYGGKEYKVNVDLNGYAKTDDVAVVYVDNDKNKSLHTTNSGTIGNNSIALGKKAIASNDSIAIGDNSHAGNKGTVLGTKAQSIREGATVVGYNANSYGLYSTVVGTNATINSNGKTVYGKIVQGAAATLVGAMNTVDNKDGEEYSGVANNIMGAANTITASNGVTIQGSGNTVTDAYKDMKISLSDGLAILGGDYSVLAKKESGAVAVVGGANTVSKQTSTTVIGYGNTVKGDNTTSGVLVAGTKNNLTNVSASLIMGDNNTLNNRENVILLGNGNSITANNAVAIGNGAGVSEDGGVALGVGSVASTAAGVLGFGADGQEDAIWKATKGAVSVGGNGETRQITNVAAGTADTDAVNVAQLKTAKTEVQAGANTSVVKDTGANGQDIYTINAKDTTYAAGNGITISGENNEISVKVKAGENNIQVTDAGLELKKDLTVDSVKAGSSFMSATGIGYGDKAYITSSGLNANNQKITGVADGTDDTDAVNVGQLKTVSEVANQGWKLSTNGDAASKVAPGEIVDFSGDKNISVSHNGTKVKVELNDELENIKSISNGDSRINLNADSISISNGNKSFAITNSGIGMSYITADYSAKSIMLGENGTTISGGLNVAGSKITGVAAGTIAAGSTDAVNGSQLNDIKNSINTDISNKTFGLKDDKGSEVTSTLGNTVQVKGADGITSTVKDGVLEIGLKLQDNSNLVVNSNGLALNTALTGIQSINGTGAGSISFNGGNVKVNQNTFNSDGRIQNVANGTETKDAVNFGQLDATNKK